MKKIRRGDEHDEEEEVEKRMKKKEEKGDSRMRIVNCE